MLRVRHGHLIQVVLKIRRLLDRRARMGQDRAEGVVEKLRVGWA